MNPDNKKIAVEATRDFIIELLQAGKYCEAKRCLLKIGFMRDEDNP